MAIAGFDLLSNLCRATVLACQAILRVLALRALKRKLGMFGLLYPMYLGVLKYRVREPGLYT